MRNLATLFVVVVGLALAGCVTETENDAYTVNLLGGGDQGAITSIYGVSLRGRTDPLFGVIGDFNGGLAWRPADGGWYAITHDAQEVSTLHRIHPNAAQNAMFALGNRFDRGLAYRNQDQQLYALSRNQSGVVSLNRIDLAGSTAPIATLGSDFYGLTYDPVTDQFYSLRNDGAGFFTLTRISPAGATAPLFGVGRNFQNGLAYHPGRGLFFAVAEDDEGFAWLHEIKLTGRTNKLFGLGFGFHDASTSLARGVPAPGLWRRAPIRGERFVAGEDILFDAAVTLASPSEGYAVADGSQITWVSDIDGPIGAGGLVRSSGLSVGEHEITINGYGFTETVTIRVYADLGAFYTSEPSPAEVSRIRRDFDLAYLDGAGVDESWAPYRGAPFNPSLPGPSDLRVIALLDLMRHQQFSEPLPMTGGQSIYDHFRAYAQRIEMRLDCGVSAAQTDGITLNRTLSQWISGDGGAQCKQTQAGAPLTPYILPAALLVHESRHLQSTDPGHTDCIGGSSLFSDQRLENGSGHAWSALYAMWVYKYGAFDSADAKTWARQTAQQALGGRFCEAPSHSDPKVQAIIDELMTP
ncbi:MAG: hypothetical protein AAF936_06180 [Pseudomonadota bacterium]